MDTLVLSHGCVLKPHCAHVLVFPWFLLLSEGLVGVVMMGMPPYAHQKADVQLTCLGLDLQRRVGTLLQRRVAVGISSGQCFIGPAGSKRRQEYSVVGDSVNLAARLMGLCAKFEVDEGVFADESISKSDVLLDAGISCQAAGSFQIKVCAYQ